MKCDISLNTLKEVAKLQLLIKMLHQQNTRPFNFTFKHGALIANKNISHRQTHNANEILYGSADCSIINIWRDKILLVESWNIFSLPKFNWTLFSCSSQHFYNIIIYIYYIYFYNIIFLAQLYLKYIKTKTI